MSINKERTLMAGKKFLNPFIKIIICLLGLLILGYFSHSSLREVVLGDGSADKILVVRLFVMIGFLYLLAQSVREIMKKDAS
jgi:hypothetical protein